MASAIDILRTHYQLAGASHLPSDAGASTDDAKFGRNPWFDVANLLSDVHGAAKLPFDPNAFAPTVLNCFPRFGDQQSLGRLTVFLGALWRADEAESTPTPHSHPARHARRPIGLDFGTDPSFTDDGFKAGGSASTMTPTYGLIRPADTTSSDSRDDDRPEAQHPLLVPVPAVRNLGSTPSHPLSNALSAPLPQKRKSPCDGSEEIPRIEIPDTPAFDLPPEESPPSPPRRKKRRISTYTKSKLLTETQKRQNHVLSEQQRRARINELFEEIRMLTPGLLTGYCSKRELIQRFGDHMRYLKHGNAMLREYLDRLEADASVGTRMYVAGYREELEGLSGVQGDIDAVMGAKIFFGG